MQVQPIDRSIPPSILSRYNELGNTGSVALYSNRFEDAERLFKMQLRLLLDTQTQANRPIHKGAPYYNLGFSLLGQNHTEETIRHILLAYVEDTLNVGFDIEDDADPT